MRNETLAGFYKAQWNALKDAGNAFHKQLKTDNAQRSESLQWDERSMRAWFTPLAHMEDLEEARELIQQTRSGLLFLMFNPGPRSESLLSAIIGLQKNPKILVRGVVNQDPSTAKNPVQIFRSKDVLRGSFQVALPTAIEKHVSFWIPELKKLQGAWAMVHSKVIVIDPFGKKPVVMTGSHNLGPAASENNDDNLLIVKDDPELAAAYAVNIIAIHSSYRWRYNRLYSHQARAFTHLEDNDTWQAGHLRGAALQDLNFWFAK
jgi:phosphatidylserine/phosphatidylglycerophosphate/cardiolipin synthase-like enzyme